MKTLLVGLVLLVAACASKPVPTGMGMNGTAGVGPAGTQFHGATPTN